MHAFNTSHPPLTTFTAKRAETRPCPACSELIPIRLLAAHAELEMQRVEDIIKHIGDAEVLAEVDDLEEGQVSHLFPSSRGTHYRPWSTTEQSEC